MSLNYDSIIIAQSKLKISVFDLLEEQEETKLTKFKDTFNCCTNTCNLVDTYIKDKEAKILKVDKELLSLQKVLTDKRTDASEVWVGKANSKGKKLKQSLLSKIDTAKRIQIKLNKSCNCE